MTYFGKIGEPFPGSGVLSVINLPFMGIVFLTFEAGCKNERTRNSFSNAAFLKCCHTVVSEISNLTASSLGSQSQATEELLLKY